MIRFQCPNCGQPGEADVYDCPAGQTRCKVCTLIFPLPELIDIALTDGDVEKIWVLYPKS